MMFVYKNTFVYVDFVLFFYDFYLYIDFVIQYFFHRFSFVLNLFFLYKYHLSLGV